MCSPAEVAGQFRLSEQHVSAEVQRLRNALLAEAKAAPWLSHLTSKMVAPHWRVIVRLSDASRRYFCLTDLPAKDPNGRLVCSGG